MLPPARQSYPLLKAPVTYSSPADLHALLKNTHIIYTRESSKGETAREARMNVGSSTVEASLLQKAVASRIVYHRRCHICVRRIVTTRDSAVFAWKLRPMLRLRVRRSYVRLAFQVTLVNSFLLAQCHPSVRSGGLNRGLFCFPPEGHFF